jgi:23S rRNA pseudouridine2605 synthase
MARHNSSRGEDRRPPKRDRRPPSHSKPRAGPRKGPRPGASGGPPRPGPQAKAKAKSGGRPEPGKGTSQRSAEPSSSEPQRLQKILAHAGLGSRRDCEEYILQGRVTVDGKVVRELGTRVDVKQSSIAVDGERIQLEKMVYYAVNKPKGYVSTNQDPAGRPRVIDLLPEVPQRVYSVGRLDEDSTGLMILTNDGELANRLAHPRYGVEKIYRALVAGTPGPELVGKLVEGIWLSDGKVRAKRARIVGTQGEATTLELVLAEGKKREIRRMLAKFGHKVMNLTRVAIGPIVLKGLPPGEHRPLSATEIELLRRVAAGIAVSPPRFHDQSRGHRAPGRGPRRQTENREQADGRPPRPERRGSTERPRTDRSPRPAPAPAQGKPMPGKLAPPRSVPGKPAIPKPMPGKAALPRP